jgi:hypothetical protein
MAESRDAVKPRSSFVLGIDDQANTAASARIERAIESYNSAAPRLRPWKLRSTARRPISAAGVRDSAAAYASTTRGLLIGMLAAGSRSPLRVSPSIVIPALHDVELLIAALS